MTPISSPNQHGLPVIRVSEIPLEPQPRRWLIEGLWGAAAVGFIGGPPKCCKSYLGLDLALSVATGTPALGIYPIHEAGPTLVYLAEDALAIVRQRVAALARHRRVAFAEVNMHVITAACLRLDRRDDLDRLFETARQLRPKLLLLDPLVRLHAIDENSAADVARLLSALRHLQRDLDLAIALVHHTRKMIPPGMAAGQGLRGSTDLHAFGDSNLYLRRERGRLTLLMEHRAAAAPPPVNLELISGDEPTIHLEVIPRCAQDDPQSPHPDLPLAVLQALQRRPRMTRQALRQQLGVQNERLGRVLTTLQDQGQIHRDNGGWSATDGGDDGTVPRSPL